LVTRQAAVAAAKIVGLDKALIADVAEGQLAHPAAREVEVVHQAVGRIAIIPVTLVIHAGGRRPAVPVFALARHSNDCFMLTMTPVSADHHDNVIHASRTRFQTLVQIRP
jgi:hypothetical protein